MPSLPPVSKVVRVDFVQTFGADVDVQNRAFFQYVGVLSNADALTWANAIATSWVAHILSLQSTALSLTSTKLTDLSSNTAPQVISVVTGAGSDAQPILTAGTAVVVRKKIARRYRGGHPRSYIPGLTQPNLASAQNLSAGYIAAMNAHFAAFISDVLTNVPAAAAPATEVNVSYFSGFTVSAPIGRRAKNIPTLRVTPVVDAVIANTTNPRIASQRRRDLQSA